MSMRKFGLVVITGLPGTGKTTLARYLAEHLGLPLIAKDTIKEPLLDVLGSAPTRLIATPRLAGSSRALSDLAFSVLFALAREQLRAGVTLILEGNFRAGEHERPMLAALPPRLPIIQVLCRTDEVLRRTRLTGRSSDPSRHPGHTHQLDPAAECDTFLALPGERLVFSGGLEGQDDLAALVERLKGPGASQIV
jgi:predicted kinase